MGFVVKVSAQDRGGAGPASGEWTRDPDTHSWGSDRSSESAAVTELWPWAPARVSELQVSVSPAPHGLTSPRRVRRPWAGQRDVAHPHMIWGDHPHLVQRRMRRQRS